MSEDDYLLATSPVTVRGTLDIKQLSETFNYAMVMSNPVAEVVRICSLVDIQDQATALPCPRDDNNNYVLLTGNILQGHACCDYCINQIDCYILGVTKKFILASKYGK